MTKTVNYESSIVHVFDNERKITEEKPDDMVKNLTYEYQCPKIVNKDKLELLDEQLSDKQSEVVNSS